MRFNDTQIQWKYSFIIMLIFVGCATTGIVGTNFMSTNVPMIRLNITSEAEIRKWFGMSPDEITQGSGRIETELLHYVYGKGNRADGHIRQLTVEIYKGVVHSYVFFSSFPEDNTDFDIERRNQLEIGKTTMVDTKSIFGTPTGRAQPPTNMFSVDMRDAAIEGTKEIWCFWYFTAGMDGFKSWYYLKRLHLYFDDAGILIHTEVFEGDV